MRKLKTPETMLLAAMLGLLALAMFGELVLIELVLTTATSTWCQLRPDSTGLGVDCLGMVMAFAGVLGLAVAGRISHRAGIATAAVVLLLGPMSIWFWLSSANVLPWLVIQFGGMAIILWMASSKLLVKTLAVRWGVVIAVYAIAKLFEAADHQIQALTSRVVSGHSLNYFVASFAAWPVLTTLSDALGRSQNKGRIHITNSDDNAAYQDCSATKTTGK